MIQNINKYVNSVVLELKKVSWLSKDELVGSTMVVGVFAVIIGIFLFIIDFGLSEIVSRLLGGK